MDLFTHFLYGVYWTYNPPILTLDLNKPNGTSKWDWEVELSHQKKKTSTLHHTGCLI